MQIFHIFLNGMRIFFIFLQKKIAEKFPINFFLSKILKQFLKKELTNLTDTIDQLSRQIAKIQSMNEFNELTVHSIKLRHFEWESNNSVRLTH